MLRGKYGDGITYLNYVGPFIMLMMKKILKGGIFRSLNVSFVTKIM
jgi:hypothetical protein